MFCQFCGHELKDENKFCPMCGKPVPGTPEAEVNAAPEEEAVRPEAPAAEADAASEGEAVEPEMTAAQPSAPERGEMSWEANGKRYRGNTGFIVGIIAVVGILVIIALFAAVNISARKTMHYLRENNIQFQYEDRGTTPYYHDHDEDSDDWDDDSDDWDDHDDWDFNDHYGSDSDSDYGDFF